VLLELRLAWRNVWRNPRRTVLTVAATVFAVFLVVVFVALGAGSHEKWIEDTVRVHSGHLAVTGEGYLENRTLEHHLTFDAGLRETLGGTPGVAGMAPRLMAFGLLSKTQSAQGAMVIGVDPELEGTVSTLPRRVRPGRFLGADTPGGIVLGERMAKSLGAGLGDEVLLYSVAWSLEMAYELYTVVGLLRLPEANFERRFAAIRLDDAQAFFAFPGRVTEVALRARSADDVAPVVASLRERLPELGQQVEVHPWYELLPELEQMILLDDAQMYITLVILVIVVAFGILNTILMSVLERRRELGVMLALGLRPAALYRLVFIESLMLAGVGLAIGLALAIPVVLVLQANPIPIESAEMAAAIELFGFEPVMVWKLKPLNPLGSSLAIFGVAILAALYPAWKASRSRPADALRAV
jgi:putative ABC transport system permease protein